MEKAVIWPCGHAVCEEIGNHIPVANYSAHALLLVPKVNGSWAVALPHKRVEQVYTLPGGIGENEDRVEGVECWLHTLLREVWEETMLSLRRDVFVDQATGRYRYVMVKGRGPNVSPVFIGLLSDAFRVAQQATMIQVRTARAENPSSWREMDDIALFRLAREPERLRFPREEHASGSVDDFATKAMRLLLDQGDRFRAWFPDKGTWPMDLLPAPRPVPAPAPVAPPMPAPRPMPAPAPLPAPAPHPPPAPAPLPVPAPPAETVPRDAEYINAFRRRYAYPGEPIAILNDDDIAWEALVNVIGAINAAVYKTMGDAWVKIIMSLVRIRHGYDSVDAFERDEAIHLSGLDDAHRHGYRDENADYDRVLGVFLHRLLGNRQHFQISRPMQPAAPILRAPPPAPSPESDGALIRRDMEEILGESLDGAELDDAGRIDRVHLLRDSPERPILRAVAAIDPDVQTALRAWYDVVKPELETLAGDRLAIFAGILDIFSILYKWSNAPVEQPLAMVAAAAPPPAGRAGLIGLVKRVANAVLDFSLRMADFLETMPSAIDVVGIIGDAGVNAIVRMAGQIVKGAVIPTTTLLAGEIVKGTVSSTTTLLAKCLTLAERASHAVAVTAIAAMRRAVDQTLAAELDKAAAYAETRRRMRATYMPVPADVVVWDNDRITALTEQGHSRKVGTLSKALLVWAQRRDEPLDRIFEGIVPNPVALAMLERQGGGRADETWVRLLAAWTGQTRSAAEARHLVPLVHFLRRAVFQALVTYWARTITGARVGALIVNINVLSRDVLCVMAPDAPILPLDEAMLVELPGGRMEALPPGVVELDQVIVATPVSPGNWASPGLVYNMPLPFVLDQWTPLRREWDVQPTMRPAVITTDRRRGESRLWHVGRRLYITSLKAATSSVYVRQMIEPAQQLVPKEEDTSVVDGMDSRPAGLWHWLSGRFPAPAWEHLAREDVLLLVRFALGVGTDLPREVARFDVLLPDEERRLYSLQP